MYMHAYAYVQLCSVYISLIMYCTCMRMYMYNYAQCIYFVDYANIYIYTHTHTHTNTYKCIHNMAQCFAADALSCLSFASYASCRPCIIHIHVYVCMYAYMYHKYIAPHSLPLQAVSLSKSLNVQIQGVYTYV